MATYGDGYRWYATGIVHDETGFPATNDPKKINDLVKRIISKIEDHQEEIESYEEYLTKMRKFSSSASVWWVDRQKPPLTPHGHRN
jgi:pyruvate/2-oxoacid:ferredoxin oxidoreductase alpha subunit